MRPGLTTVGDYRTLIAITQAYYGALTLAVAEDGEHHGQVVTLRTLALGGDTSEAAANAIVAAAEASSKVAHDNIVPLLNIVRGHEETTLVNAHVDGAPLHILARMLMTGREALDVGVFLQLTADVLGALDLLHASPDYLPGGLTPQCVWVGADGRTRLHEPMVQGRLGAIPFLAGHLERVPYRAPEQLRTAAEPDARSDLFSVGVMLWELLQGKRLFAGFDAAAIAERITGSDAPPLEGDGITVELTAVVAKALAREPGDRYADTTEFLAALKAAPLVTASSASVAALVEKLLGGHPSVQRVRDTAAKYAPRPASTPASSTAASEKKPPRAKLPRRALPTPARPLTVPLRFKRPPAKPETRAAGEAVDDPYEPSRESIAELDLLLDSALTPRAVEEDGASDSEQPPPSTDSWMPADSERPPMPSEAEVEEGARRQVGRCELFVEIAQGHMATIYLGRWIGAGGFAKLVAVKAMHPQYTGNREFVSMFLDEARVVARVSHPNVMQTIDLVESDGDLFIVMDYAKGVTLGHLQRQMKRNQTKMPIANALRIVHGVLEGLHAAHEASDESGEPMNIVHRDVTPGNVLVGTDGYAKLIDFGIARALGRVAGSDADPLGSTPEYLAPEQLAGGEVCRQTDLYSASVMLWQALTGHRAFKGDDLAAISHQILNREVPPPSKLRAGISPELDRVVMKGMARKREDRWETAEQMAEALRKTGELASHREVGAWVGEAASERLEQAEAVLQAVENAPVTLSEDDLEEPLSVRAADRQSLTHDVVFAARQLGAPRDVTSQPSAPPQSTSAPPQSTSAPPQSTSAPPQSTSAPPQPTSRRGLYLVAAGVGALLLVAVLVAVLVGLSGPSKDTPAPSAPATSGPTPATAAPASSRAVGPSASATTTPSSSQTALPSATVSAVPFPPYKSAAPASTAPWPAATATPTATKRLPDGI